MLILVAVTVRTVVQSGLFGHAGKATSGYSMQEAREQLGTTLAGAMTQKYTNKDYDEDDYLTEYITTNLSGSKVAGNVVLVDGWAFEIDRDKLEIINDLGKGNPEDFKQPELTVTKGDLVEDTLSLPLNITALEDINGINKIEIIKDGTVIHTIPGNNSKTAINDSYIVEKNGKYVVKVYAKLTATKTIEVTELILPKPTLEVEKGTLASNQLSIPITISAQEAKFGINKIDIFKQGQITPETTYTYDNRKDTITETYSATENTTYTIKAHTSRGEEETKTMQITEIVPPSPTAPNAYVRYSPDTVSNYTKITQKTSGYNASQSIPQDTDLMWKVLSINNDGTIDLIADRPINTTVYFQGDVGYNNGVYLLNDLCKSQYSHHRSDYNADARSINLEDIEKHFNDAGRAARAAYTYQEITYGQTKTYTGNNTYTPYMYRAFDKDVTQTPNNIAQVESNPHFLISIQMTPSQENSLTVTQTAYSFVSQDSYYDDPNFHNLIFGTGTNYWFASRYVECDSTHAIFGLRRVHNSAFSLRDLFSSNMSNSISNGCYAVRPVVSLPSTVKLQNVPGTMEWEIVEK